MTLPEARTEFHSALLRTLEEGRSSWERDRQAGIFMEVLDEMIAWSEQHADRIEFGRRKTGASKPQARVTFYLRHENAAYASSPFWDAYPDKDPKLSFLVDTTRKADGAGWTDDLREPFKTQLESIGILEADRYPTVRFKNICAPVHRPRIAAITDMLETVLNDPRTRS